jgi:hypothetical protein
MTEEKISITSSRNQKSLAFLRGKNNFSRPGPETGYARAGFLLLRREILPRFLHLSNSGEQNRFQRIITSHESFTGIPLGKFSHSPAVFPASGCPFPAIRDTVHSLPDTLKTPSHFLTPLDENESHGILWIFPATPPGPRHHNAVRVFCRVSFAGIFPAREREAEC